MFKIKGKYTEAVVYTDNCEETAVAQIYKLCNHPAFADSIIRIMPDVHAGEGCVIGTTILLKEKKVIPDIVGVDIGCGVMATIFCLEEEPDYERLEKFIRENIPSGHDIRESVHPLLSHKVEEDVRNICDELHFCNVDAFINSVGTLGGGNHFIEIDKMGDSYVLLVHTGSRNLGHKVCGHFTSLAVKGMKRTAQNKLVTSLKAESRYDEIEKELKEFSERYEKEKFPKELSYVEGEDYYAYIRNMLRCQAVAEESRRLISADIVSFLGVKNTTIFDTVHNYIEETEDGILIRKGAVSAKVGEKVCIPLNMKDGCIIGVGKGNKDWNFSAPHGAGRVLSRSAAKSSLSVEEFRCKMAGIHTWSVGEGTLDESPMAYKPAKDIVELVADTLDNLQTTYPVYNFKAI